jgi:diaminohydroxyphosphoribosylaminopyrimidine deaminase / 5-amino-6-(5-phosphoribosylamino)uracil reductase
MNPISQERLWELLLQIRKEIIKAPANVNTVLILCYNTKFDVHINNIQELCCDDRAILISKEPEPYQFPGLISFVLDENYNIKFFKNQLFDDDQIEFIVSYLPFCFAAAKAHQLKRSVAIVHFAQTLDGRIATESGNSKWISNHENLVHSHRMRALCDSVLIGANTLKKDKPSLTVRLVKGPNPMKIVIGNSVQNFESLLENEGKVILFTSNMNGDINGIEKVQLPEKGNRISPSLILKELYQRGIYSIYIEGGSATASSFLEDQSIDILQIFLAPKIFGTGISCFNMSSMQNAEDLMEFVNYSFKPMGNGVLFEGEIQYLKQGL